MKKSTRPRQAAPATSATTPSPFNARAVQAFTALPPTIQALILWTIAESLRIPPSRLYATEAQREAARATTERIKANDAATETKARERMAIRRKWNALHNRAQLRNNRRSYLTPAANARAEALMARLNKLDGITETGA